MASQINLPAPRITNLVIRISTSHCGRRCGRLKLLPGNQTSAYPVPQPLSPPQTAGYCSYGLGNFTAAFSSVYYPSGHFTWPECPFSISFFSTLLEIPPLGFMHSHSQSSHQHHGRQQKTFPGHVHKQGWHHRVAPGRLMTLPQSAPPPDAWFGRCVDLQGK